MVEPSTAGRSGSLWSNKVVVVVAVLLAAGILSDGVFYRRPTVTDQIFAGEPPGHITIAQNGRTVMAFSKASGSWLLTEPSIAPASEARLQMLLESNHQSQRSYEPSQLPLETLFADPVILQLNEHQFSFGQIEPVSKMRFVHAGEKIYLQADHVIPLLQAGPNAFIDLQVSGQVHTVSIGQKSLSNIDNWQGLRALGVVAMSAVDRSPITSVRLQDAEKKLSVLDVYSINDSLVLQPQNASYGFLLSSAQVTDLGLTQYLSGA